MMHKIKKSGFTIIELLIVIGITTTLAVVAVPNYLNYRQKAVIDSDAGKITAVLREAISKARSGAEGARWTFYVDENDGWYAIQQGPTLTPATYINTNYLDSSVTFSTTTNINQYWFHQSPNLTVATSTMVISLATQGGSFTDTITMDTFGKITRESSY